MALRREALRRIGEAATKWGSEGQGALVDALEQATVEMFDGANGRPRTAAKVERRPARKRQSRAVPLQLLTLPQVASQLSVSRRTVEKLIARGDIPVTRIGASTRVDSDDLAEWVRNQKTSGAYTSRTPGGRVGHRTSGGTDRAAQDKGRGDRL